MIQFILRDDQEEKVKAWQRNHECKFRDPVTHQRRGGTLGDLDTYHFSLNNVGMIISVECGCGARIDVSDML